MDTLVKEDRHNEDTILTKREIDLAYGLKDKHASIFNHIIQLFFIILMYMVHFFLRILSNYKYVYIE